jgi:hypothetical protein
MARERGSGSLRLRGGIYQARYWHNGQKIEESTKTSDLARARKFLRGRLKTAGTPEFLGPQAERVTFADLKAGILHDYTAVRRNRSTKRLKEALAHLEGTFGSMLALAITDESVRAYVAARTDEGASASTVNRELAALRRMFKLHKLVRRHVPEIRLADESGNVREGFLEPADFGAFLSHLPPAVADAALFAYLSLWRRENVLGLQWTHVTLETDADGGAIGGSIRLPHVLTKNKRPLTLVLKGQRLLDLMGRRAALRVLACPFVFHRNGRRLSDFRTVWEQAAEAIGRPELLFHDMRRSGARNLRKAGVSESTIMRQGGWKTRSMFLRYDITDDSDLAESATVYDDYLTEAETKARKVINLSERKRTHA